MEKPVEKERKNFLIDPDVVGLLERVDNKSEYVSKAVRRCWHRWQRGLTVLRAAGWTGGELLAVCDVLNGSILEAYDRLGDVIALDLTDAIEDGICQKWDVSPQRWKGRIGNVQGSEPVASALADLVEEFWSGNDELERQLRR